MTDRIDTQKIEDILAMFAIAIDEAGARFSQGKYSEAEYDKADDKSYEEAKQAITALLKVEVAKAKIAENQIEHTFHIDIDRSADYKAGFDDAVKQLIKCRDLRIAEVESNEV